MTPVPWGVFFLYGLSVGCTLSTVIVDNYADVNDGVPTSSGLEVISGTCETVTISTASYLHLLVSNSPSDSATTSVTSSSSDSATASVTSSPSGTPSVSPSPSVSATRSATATRSPVGCTHSEMDTGEPLVTTCSNCATLICGQSPQCCSVYWDGACANAARIQCVSATPGLTPSASVTTDLTPTASTSLSASTSFSRSATATVTTTPESTPIPYDLLYNSTLVMGWGNNMAVGSTQGYSGVVVPIQWTALAYPSAGIRNVIAGGAYALAVTNDGALYAWGLNYYGELGAGPAVAYHTRPAPVVYQGTPLSGCTMAAAHNTLACAICNNTLFCWGQGTYGTLGNGTLYVNSPYPVQANVTALGGSAITGLATGQNFALLTTADHVYSWGINLATGAWVPYPQLFSPAVFTLGRIAAVACGNEHAVALGVVSTELFAWGANNFGQRGQGTDTSSSYSTPALVLWSGTPMPGAGVLKIAAGGHSSYVIGGDSNVYAWGSNVYGQLGDSTTTLRSNPVLVLLPLGAYVDVAGGAEWAMALRSTGVVFTWGNNNAYQLGDQSFTASRSTPGAVIGLYGGVAAISASDINGFALLSMVSITPSRSPVSQTPSSSGSKTASLSVTSSISVSASLSASRTPSLTRTPSPSPTASVTPSVSLSAAATVSATPSISLSTTPSISVTPSITPSTSPTRSTTPSTSPTSSTTPSFSATTTRSPVGCAHSEGDVGAALHAGCSPCAGAVCTVDAFCCAGGWDAYCVSQVEALCVSATPGLTPTASVSANLTPTQSGVVTTHSNSATPSESPSFSPYPTLTYDVLANNSVVLAWGKSTACGAGDLNGLPRENPAPVVWPQLALPAAGIRAVARGPSAESALAVGYDGHVFGWGRNAGGELGIGVAWPRAYPGRVVWGLAAFPYGGCSSVAAGRWHACAVCGNGKAYCWGSNSAGQLGNSTYATSALYPVEVNTTLLDSPVSSMACGAFFTVVATSTGAVYTWGSNGAGELGGRPLVTSSVGTPFLVAWSAAPFPAGGIARVAAGNAFALALGVDATVLFAWGDNGFGQLGDGTTSDRMNPVAVVWNTTAPASVLRIAAGEYFSLAVGSDTRLYAWGANGAGQLGSSTGDAIATSATAVVFALPPSDGFVDVSAGGLHSLALHGSGVVFSWGGNANGQLGVVNGLSQSPPQRVTALEGLAGAFAATRYNSYAIVGGVSSSPTATVSVAGTASATSTVSGASTVSPSRTETTSRTGSNTASTSVGASPSPTPSVTCGPLPVGVVVSALNNDTSITIGALRNVVCAAVPDIESLLVCLAGGVWSAYPARQCLAQMGCDGLGTLFLQGDCVPCPSRGCFCPGGLRIWPLPGYWSSNELEMPLQCRNPTACLGAADVSIARTDGIQGRQTGRCATGYGGSYCAQCSTGFYSAFDSCLQCPSNSSANLAYLAIAAGILFSLMAVGVATLPVKFLGIFVSALVSLQQATLIGRIAATRVAGSNPDLAKALTYLAIFSFDVEFAAAECSTGITVGYITLFWATLAMWLIVAVMFLMASAARAGVIMFLAHRREKKNQKLPGLARALSVMALGVSTRTTPVDSQAVTRAVAGFQTELDRQLSIIKTDEEAKKRFVSTADCEELELRGKAMAKRVRNGYRLLAADAAALSVPPTRKALFLKLFMRRGIRALITLGAIFYLQICTRVFQGFGCVRAENGALLLNAQLNVTCFEGAHLGAFPVMLALFIFYIIGFPVGGLLVLRRHYRNGRLESSSVVKRWGSLYSGLRPAFFWFKSIAFVATFVATAATAFSNESSPRLVASGIIFMSRLALVVSLRPHQKLLVTVITGLTDLFKSLLPLVILGKDGVSPSFVAFVVMVVLFAVGAVVGLVVRYILWDRTCVARLRTRFAERCCPASKPDEDPLDFDGEGAALEDVALDPTEDAAAVAWAAGGLDKPVLHNVV